MNVSLSVIIPTYNCEKYVKECIDSVYEQLEKDCEIIAIDDGSSDKTVSILEEFERIHENIIVIKNTHGGPSFARNSGIKAAHGKLLAFVDCDDKLHKDFYKNASSLFVANSDLYIFGMERMLLNGQEEALVLEDKKYEDISYFADDYIRKRKMLMYSVCNKIYKRELIIKNGLWFDEHYSFGEDRLFNFEYLKVCKNVTVSSVIMQDYIQRSTSSLSMRHIPQFFELSSALNEEKIKCFLNLSKGTDKRERNEFIAYSISSEVENAIERFEKFSEEKQENLPLINKLVFEEPSDPDTPLDIIFVLGSNNCGYKMEKALEIGKKNPGADFIVSGGNLHLNKKQSEADFMASCLIENGILKEHIFTEDQARNTWDNFEKSLPIINSLQKKYKRPVSIGIVTGGFHIKRARHIAESFEQYKSFNLSYFSAFGSHTHLDNWFDNPTGKSIILGELRKREYL